MRYRSLKSKKIYNAGYDAGQKDERQHIIELIQREFISGSRSTLISLIELLQAEMRMRQGNNC